MSPEMASHDDLVAIVAVSFAIQLRWSTNNAV